ncbi:MAG: hypothetical protein FJY26_05315 [Betaproteobacteria bacterium]|nr:hypothetical protein [Betaproteobacteria bacterium]
MNLILMTPAAQGGNSAEPLQDHNGHALLQRWSPLMTRLIPTWDLLEQDESLNTLAERSLARLVYNRPLSAADDGRLPLQAWSLRGACGGKAWGRLSPFHGLVAADRITLLPPEELQLSASDSQALFDAVAPLFASEGVDLQWQAPLHWLIGHDSLRGLSCASRLRAEGDSVQRWQGRTPLSTARLLRRLQNEAQMVLHEHSVNHAREARGALTVNSLWLDHAGACDEAFNPTPHPTQALPWAHANAALQAWVDAALLPPAPGQAEPVLVLCGRHAAQAFAMRRLPTGWRGAIARTIKPQPRTRALSDWLQRLDAPAQGAPA